jgi:predicted short-subunit dehydrogenase-like oxidoreductase (DUF2520 family)
MGRNHHHGHRFLDGGVEAHWRIQQTKARMNLRVAIAGSGKVATAMALRMLEGGMPPAAILARNRSTGQFLANRSDSIFLPIEEIETGASFDLILLCVADGAVAATAQLLRPFTSHLLHVSGTVPLGALGSGSHGVFYPLMTFPAETEPDWDGVKIFVETSQPDLPELLSILACRLQVELLPADSQQRFRLHLAAVFANNFTVAAVRAANALLDEARQERSTLLPLLRATFRLLLEKDADLLQTGPAQRGDTPTMEAHLRALSAHPDLADMYAAISRFVEERR